MKRKWLWRVLMTKIYVPRAVGWFSIILGMLVLIVCLGTGYLLDDMDLDPFFGFKGENASESRKEILVESDEGQCFTKVVRVTINPKSGNMGGSVSTEVYQHATRVFSAGGKCPIFIGFKDINGDGRKDILVNSSSIYAEEGVWLQTADGFEETTPNRKASLMLSVAGVLLWSSLIAAGGGLLVILGLLCIWQEKPTRTEKASRRETAEAGGSGQREGEAEEDSG